MTAKELFNQVKEQTPGVVLNSRRISPLYKKAIAVQKLDPLSGEVLKTYPSYIQAARDCKLGHWLHISACIRGERETAGGFKWRKPQ